MKSRAFYISLILLALLWSFGIIYPALYPASVVSDQLYGAYSGICHQFSAFTFHIHGHPFGVCVRCTSIYFGFSLGVLIYPIFSRFKSYFPSGGLSLAIITIPMIIDVGASWLTGYSSSIVTRTVTGGFFGIGAAILLIPVYLQAFCQLTDFRSLPFKEYRKGANL